MFTYIVAFRAWLLDHYNQTIDAISVRMGLLTGLNMTFNRLSYSATEPFQVVNYGIGGHFAPHSDCMGVSTASSLLYNWL